MPIPPLDRGKVLEAMARFDRDERSSAEWQGWENKKSYKYAVAHGGRLYPVKKIVTVAANELRSAFNGGAEANGLISAAGFGIELLRSPTKGEVRAAPGSKSPQSKVEPAKTGEEALMRVHGGLSQLRKGLAPYVEAGMKSRYGASWLNHASRAKGSPATAALDLYGLLKTMLDNWYEVFDAKFDRGEKHAVRSFISLAMEARNVASHQTKPFLDEEALRYLDAMHQLLKAVSAPAPEISEAKRLYDEQRRHGI